MTYWFNVDDPEFIWTLLPSIEEQLEFNLLLLIMKWL